MDSTLDGRKCDVPVAWLAQPRAVVALALGLAYAGLALLSHSTNNPAHQISAIFLPNGLGIVAVLIWGPWLLPVFGLAHFVVDTFSDCLPATSAALLGVITMLEIGLGALLLRPREARLPTFDIAGTARFAIVGLLVVPLAASGIGSACLWMMGDLPTDHLPWAIRDWWLGDMVGILVMVPLLVTWLSHGVPRFHGRSREAGAVFLAVLVLTTLMLTYELTMSDPVKAVLYACLPLLLWSSVFLRETGAATALLLTVLATTLANHLLPAHPTPLWSIVVLLVPFGLMSLIIAVAQANLANVIALRTREHQLEQLAYSDSLTGLANRTRFHQRLTEAHQAALARGERLAVLFIDLDGFKWVNDTLGHDAGDQLIQHVGRRLAGIVKRDKDLVARLGGDEFAVLLTDVNNPREAAGIGQRIVDGFGEPVSLDATRVHVALSLGISLFPEHAQSPAELLRLADLAMYEAKKVNGSTAMLYCPSLEADARQRYELHQDLRDAIAQEQFWVAYQPVVDLVSGRMHFVEALMRWQHPTRGLVPPDQFIGLLEQSGLIVRVGRQILRQSCRMLAQWRQVQPDLRLSVNVSVAQFQGDDMVQTVLEALADAGLPHDALIVELTESRFLSENSTAATCLRRLATHGVHLALDDFGTGYSAMATLQQFPLQMIKIDRSFVSQMLNDRTSDALIETILRLSRRLGLQAVAEGVEQREQAVRLLQMGCTMAQGFYFARPQTAQQISEQLRSATALSQASTLRLAPTVR